mmetsp:Transcript_10657/g.10768  ORF Transcript_10657/g.10768 Transcript_10657/m.10768 type:complete len:113 (-) Transcript_10657:1270-1608(-)
MKKFNRLLHRYLNYQLQAREKECIWETLKAVQNVEDNPANIDERLLDLQGFVNVRTSNKAKKINDIIKMEEDEEELVNNKKTKGMTQVDEDFVIRMALKKKGNWGGIWKSIK